MNAELLMDAMGYLPDDMVERTNKLRTAKPVAWYRWAALAASICLVLGLGSLLLPELAKKSTDDSAEVLTDEAGSTSMAPLTATVTVVETTRLYVELADGTQREVSLAQLSQIPALEPGMQIKLYFAHVGTTDEDGADTEQVLTPCRIEIKEE